MSGKSDQINELLNSPLMVEAWENTRQYLIQQLVDADSEDVEAIQDFKRRIISLEAVKADLRLTMDDERLDDELEAIEEDET